MEPKQQKPPAEPLEKQYLQLFTVGHDHQHEASEQPDEQWSLEQPSALQHVESVTTYDTGGRAITQ